ncbi:MAG: OmpA family protein [Bacteroidota bacterium]
MKHQDRTEEHLTAFFEQLKAEEQLQSPSFSVVYERALIQQRRRRLLRYFGLGLLLVTIIIGAWQYEKCFNSPEKEVPIIRASTNYYVSLMEDGKIITNDIHFEYNDVQIKVASAVIIQDIAKMMKKHPELRLSIEGHTDNTGPTNYNLMLSKVRSEAVMDALIKLGIDKDRLFAKGFGETRPTSSNEIEAGRQLNRRVEFVLLDER